jgi:hypothetical protein
MSGQSINRSGFEPGTTRMHGSVYQDNLIQFTTAKYVFIRFLLIISFFHILDLPCDIQIYLPFMLLNERKTVALEEYFFSYALLKKTWFPQLGSVVIRRY